jgi:hypothetical protein
MAKQLHNVNSIRGFHTEKWKLNSFIDSVKKRFTLWKGILLNLLLLHGTVYRLQSAHIIKLTE